MSARSDRHRWKRSLESIFRHEISRRPQQPPLLARSVHAAQQLASEGRALRIGFISLTVDDGRDVFPVARKVSILRDLCWPFGLVSLEMEDTDLRTRQLQKDRNDAGTSRQSSSCHLRDWSRIFQYKGKGENHDCDQSGIGLPEPAGRCGIRVFPQKTLSWILLRC